MMNMAQKGAAMLVAVFLVGVVVGAAGDRLLDRGPRLGMRGPGRGSSATLKALGLTPAQCAAIDSVFERGRPRMAAAFAELEPRMKAVTDSIREEFRAVLTPAQREKFDSAAPAGGMFGREFRGGPRGGGPRDGFREGGGRSGGLGGRNRPPGPCS
jgi:Spy/CpxP family protein refolding chaperone